MMHISAALACESWGPLTTLIPLEHRDLTESSGLAISRRTPNVLWTHDDAGEPNLFRFTLSGEVSKHEVPGAHNRDWEDIASAGCPGLGDCLYIGDIGAERSDPQVITVYVATEPRGEGPATVVEQWNLSWPGVPRDAESLIVHPCTLDAWILTRTNPPEVYKIPAERGRTEVALLPVATLPLDEPLTAADFSPDGTQIVLRSLDKAWRLPVSADSNEPSWDAPSLITEGLASGEAIAWDLDGDLLLTSEGFPTPLGRMACSDGQTPTVCQPKRCGCQTQSLPRSLLSLLRRRP